MKILIVEDDAIIASGLEYAILQLFLPYGNRYTICEAVKRKREVAVIFLTAVDDEGNVVKGLDMDADDYITVTV